MWRICVLVCIVVLFVSSHSAQAIIISDSQNAGTAGLGHNPADPWKGVGMVGAGPANNRNYFCTGTLIDMGPNIAKKWVLTAAHCMCDNAFDIDPQHPYPGGSQPPSPSPPYYPRPRVPEIPPTDPIPPNPNNPFLGAFPANQMWFHLPLENAAVHHQSMAIFVHPNYIAGDTTYDVALIELMAPVNSTAWRINSGQIADERATPNTVLWGHKVGYGAGGDATNGETLAYGIKREGFNAVDRFAGANDQLLEFDFDDHRRVVPSRIGTWIAGTEEANTTHGDSGGPMFMYDLNEDIWRIVGVTRGGDGMGAGAAGTGFVEISNDVRVQKVANWIRQIIVPPLPGDHNGDGNVDAADYVLWRKNPGAHGGNPAGYLVWRANFGASSIYGSGSLELAGVVPEPAAVTMFVLGLPFLSRHRRGRRFG